MSGRGRGIAVRTRRAAALAAAAAAACASPPPIPNFAEVEPGFYRGGQPGDEGWAALRRLGVRTVVSLRARHRDGPAAEAAGFDLVEIPLEAGPLLSRAPTDAETERFLEVVRDPQRRPVFVHCGAGEDRTGAMVAVYRIAVSGWGAERALEEMEALGFHRHYVELWAFVEAFAARRGRGVSE